MGHPEPTRRPHVPVATAAFLSLAALTLATVLTAGVQAMGAPPDHGAHQAGTSGAGAPAGEQEVESPPPVVYPDESTTGVPEGLALEASDSLTITEDGTVVDGLEVTGTVTVQADDVVIRNTRIVNTGSYPVRLDGGKGLLIEDSEIDGQGRGYGSVVFSGYTLRRVNIHHVTEGPRIAGDDVTIEDSYVHHLVQKGDNHTDVVQVVGGTGIVVRGNNLQGHNPDSGLLGNAAFMFGEDDKEVRDCTVEGNLMNGGNYTVNGGGSGTTGAQCRFRDNQFQRDARYGSHGNLGPGVDWDDSNTWHDTGEPVRSSP